MVNTQDDQVTPGNYLTYVDAANGEILYRQNKVVQIDFTVKGDIYPINSFSTQQNWPLKNLQVNIGGTNYFTNSLGLVTAPPAGPVTPTISLQGKWVKVVTGTNGNTVATYAPANVANGNTVTFQPSNPNGTERHINVYYHTNEIHDFMKTKFPNFTNLDNALTARVDRTDGDCNAFYNGTSINFYTTANGCNALSYIGDVMYHEYGHGINDKFYQSNGDNFTNGAMGEGYADLWALGITGSPILGIGFFDNDPNGFVRRYDIDKKVYPQDLVGEVHADGEIIAGAFWDMHLNLGNLQQMMDIFKETFYAGITGLDGDEGVIYHDILVETLTVDDNDGDITNGTPNYCAITSGFAIHGITLAAFSGIVHTEVLQAAAFNPITIQTTAQGLANGSVIKGYYRIGNTSSWNLFTLANTTGSTYEGTLPGQPNGTLIEYYLGVEDNCGTFLNVIPSGAADANPNIPYYILVGFDLLIYEDFDVLAGNWIAGLPTDDATTGNWVIDIPIPSYVGTSMVQPDFQVTSGGLFCAFTGNAS
ncbi:MAG TPA: hypothetical protein PLD84_16470, partial [Chitinophagales bacterium]|nr:hypothetical protein [Chitinophagales bacterium]